MIAVYDNYTNQTDRSLVPFLAPALNVFEDGGMAIYSEQNVDTSVAYNFNQFISQQAKNYSLLDFPIINQKVELYSQLGQTNTVRFFYGAMNTQETRNEKISQLMQKITNLYKILKKELFEKLNYDQILFMAKTAGAISLDDSVNIARMYGYLDQYTF